MGKSAAKKVAGISFQDMLGFAGGRHGFAAARCRFLQFARYKTCALRSMLDWSTLSAQHPVNIPGPVVLFCEKKVKNIAARCISGKGSSWRSTCRSASAVHWPSHDRTSPQTLRGFPHLRGKRCQWELRQARCGQLLRSEAAN